MSSTLLKNFFLDFAGFHGWGNNKIFRLASGLDELAIRKPMQLGPGTLHATLVHLYGAQQVWLDRWLGNPTVGLPTGEGWSLADIQARQAELDHRMHALIESTEDDPDRFIDYRNFKGEPFRHRLSDLMLHVFNHAVHHRSQALHFLKHQGITIPGGLDYLFYKLANPTLEIDSKSADFCRRIGMEVGDKSLEFLEPSLEIVRRYEAYGDWGTLRVLNQARSLTDEQLDHDFAMGRGSLRETLLHLFDAECWWQEIWKGRQIPFPRSPKTMSISSLEEKWKSMAMQRSKLLESYGQSSMSREVICDFGIGPMRFRMAESLIQLCVHGTLHRAQANNMLRRHGVQVVPLDYVVYLRESIEAETK
jgi:uncharacterized damage-inducible protein DinB